MPSSDNEDDHYDSGVDEDAELELSCALHDLAERVKSFEEKMQARFPHDDEVDEEIDEDIPEAEEAIDVSYAMASPKNPRVTGGRRRRRFREAKGAKQQDDDDNDDEEEGEEDEAGPEAKADGSDDEAHHEDEWDYQEQKEELSELKQSIALLLQGIKDEARALDMKQAKEADECDPHE
ncbi:TPA: hypothetical protein N0F65_012544 [Lagenidium giganteum]|uniref:Uncharacterized protein n=1 Tax=Lagenidium giganteum TaxID=4803 RepID=A0AAV2YPU4_9STRA|nr:TPA: hypothetical protein N0F65_012544 [Lagenidium giganteum]